MPANSDASRQRISRMEAMAKAGMTFQAIGIVESISRERVRQLLKKIGVVGRRKSEPKARVLTDVRGRLFADSYSMARDDYSLVPLALRVAYREQRRNAMYRGIPWELTLVEWLAVWKESGHLDQRGRGRGRYCMSRIGDAGAYAVGNVLIQTNEANSGDYHREKKNGRQILA